LATAGFQQLIFKVISHMEERYGLMIFSTVSYSQLCDQVISSDVYKTQILRSVHG